jgi:hypothetical protein
LSPHLYRVDWIFCKYRKTSLNMMLSFCSQGICNTGLFLEGTVKLRFCVLRICVFLCLLRMFLFILPNFHRGINFPWIFIYASCAGPQLCIQIEHKLASCCRFKYFQLQSSVKKLFAVIISYFCCPHVIHIWCVQWRNPAELPTLVHSYAI